MALVVLCLLGMVALPYWSDARSGALERELQDTLGPLEVGVERLYRQVLQMDNDLRAFLLTGDRSFVQTFDGSDALVRAELDALDRLVPRADPALAAAAHEARRGYETWLAQAQRVLALESAEGIAAARAEALSSATLLPLQGFAARVDQVARLARSRERTLRERAVAFQEVERSLVLALGALAAIVLAYLAHLVLALLKAERAAVAERDQLEAVVGAVDSGVVLLDGDLRVRVANERAGELLGVPLARLIGADQRETVRETLGPRMLDAPAFRKRADYLYDHPEAVSEDRLEIAHPEPRTLVRYSSPVRDAEGTAFGRIEVYRDVTDVLRRERELAEANERKDRFVATLSHELRTPLTPILGWIELLRRERDPLSLERGLASIERNVRLEAQLVEDLLDLSRVVNRKLELNLAPMDVAGAAMAAVETVGHLARAKGVRIESRLPSEAPRVVADEIRFIQVLWNLLSNAIKFTPPGTCVTLDVQMTGDRLEVTVEDEGEGIEADFLAHVFKPFEQGRRRDGSFGGLGVGLALSRSLVELHGGAIRAESEGAGRGARFSFWIPTTPASAPREAQPEASPVGAPAAPPDTPRAPRASAPAPPGAALREQSCDALSRVLIVEDSPDTLEAMRVLLSSWGYAVRATDGAETALMALREEPIELVISDIGMPHVDGLAFARWVRAAGSHEGARVPVLVAVSGYASPADRRRALEAGFDAYLTKPIDFAALRNLLETRLPRSQAVRA